MSYSPLIGFDAFEPPEVVPSGRVPGRSIRPIEETFQLPMSVVIRLRRTGRKNLPCYRINVTDSRFPRDGRMLETIGLYDPLRKDPAAQVVVDAERAKHWISHGAVVSEIVASILRRKGLKDLLRPRKMRERPGRSGASKTKTRATRNQRDQRMATAKAARRAERLKTRRAAKKAAAAAAGEAKS